MNYPGDGDVHVYKMYAVFIQRYIYTQLLQIWGLGIQTVHPGFIKSQICRPLPKSVTIIGIIVVYVFA